MPTDGVNSGGSLETIGKALDPLVKKLPKSSMAGLSGAGALYTIHRFVPSDFDPYQHMALDWGFTIGVLACGLIVVRGAFKVK